MMDTLYLNLLPQFLHFGSNSSVASDSGINVRDLSQVFLFRRSSPLTSMYSTGRTQTLLYGL